MNTTRHPLYCACRHCQASGQPEKMGELVEDEDGVRLEVRDKRHGVKHTLVVNQQDLEEIRRRPD